MLNRSKYLFVTVIAQANTYGRLSSICIPNRLWHNAYKPGGPIDTLFPFPGTAAAQFKSQIYSSDFAGAFQANYLHTDLITRRLHDPTSGPALKHFPLLGRLSYPRSSQRLHDKICQLMLLM